MQDRLHTPRPPSDSSIDSLVVSINELVSGMAAMSERYSERYKAGVIRLERVETIVEKNSSQIGENSVMMQSLASQQQALLERLSTLETTLISLPEIVERLVKVETRLSGDVENKLHSKIGYRELIIGMAATLSLGASIVAALTGFI